MIKKYLSYLSLLIFTISCYEESFITIEGDFTTQFVAADESVPVIIKIENTISGADTYKWEFEGGIPSESTQLNPGEITYEQPGNFEIKLIAENQDGERKEIIKKIEIKDAININFTNQIIQSNNPPVEVKLTNITNGVGLTYSWIFEGGIPATSDQKSPPNIIFTTPGNHNITLMVSNGFESDTKTQIINVAPNLVCNFNWTPNFEDEDYESPVKINLVNQSVSANSYSWTFQGGNPAISTLENPTQVNFTTGSHVITLTATNDKTSQTVFKTINVLPDSNLIILNDVKLGINAAHNSNLFGAFYSTKLRRTFSENEISAQNSNQIDIAFQGLNNLFTFNKFISPNNITNFGFSALANAQNTVFINAIDLCNCGLSGFTENQFNLMLTDSVLQTLNIPSTASPAASQEFGATFPKLVLFKTSDNRKGAIKVKSKFQNGASSYIICDIKVQKQQQ